MGYTIAEIAAHTGLSAEGDLSLSVVRPSEPSDAARDELALAMSRQYEEAVAACQAQAAVLWPGADWKALGLKAALFAPRARVALAGITGMFEPALDLEPGIHPTAIIDPSAVLAEDCWVGPYTLIGPGVVIARGARIQSHVSIERGAQIGENAIIRAGVRIGRDVRLGARVSIHPNACLGADGFSYVTPEPGSVESAKTSGAVSDAGRNLSLTRIASLGSVEVADDVEIGASSCIDRGTVADTVIGRGTKIDNLVMIGHNVRVGETCMLCGHVGLAGSITVGDRVVLGGKVGVADHVTIGHDSVVAGGSLVGSDIPPQSVMLGVPAMPRGKAIEQIMAIRRLPRALEQLRELRQKMGL
ncbi:UDP-3-O-(3-hydroxymyristoyl)glucosamine N-acyltransferase [Limibaculum sp. M0105]|uniref:UDP-3-O-(3-hydroxymyristoyl)glucosamine N-acyltransferase n=1 Tax=Thermohalobaculum xanthum TaxID=2753746 RepID=A0A8J7M5M1_9RHOB|nr:UDP-3-O-(3-hydroxymyristoyl)glucosamine N-acyltransferase [Thermohalobaculum xanthum]MBK0397869.1 UDP-3-O-(3-hydroxymyristoyl)glucosamine N-acyltransferase [Thermohalobaculum xanthum]